MLARAAANQRNSTSDNSTVVVIIEVATLAAANATRQCALRRVLHPGVPTASRSSSASSIHGISCTSGTDRRWTVDRKTLRRRPTTEHSVLLLLLALQLLCRVPTGQCQQLQHGRHHQQPDPYFASPDHHAATPYPPGPGYGGQQQQQQPDPYNANSHNRQDIPTMHHGYPASELDLPASERNSLYAYFPPARSPASSQHFGKTTVELPIGHLTAQQLYPNQDQVYTLTGVPNTVPGISITVHPRRGFITWNISNGGIDVMTHPFYTHALLQSLPQRSGQGVRQARPDPFHTGAHGLGGTGPRDPYAHHPSYPAARSHYIGRRRRKTREAPPRAPKGPAVQTLEHAGSRHRAKRCCASGAPPYNLDYDVREIHAGEGGESLGPGALTYFKEDINGGDYSIRVHNMGAGMADFLIFATLEPEHSPYPKMQNNEPQVTVQAIGSNKIDIMWEPPPESPNTVYCPVVHSASNHVPTDVHSSPYAQWMERTAALHPPCVDGTTRTTTLHDLRPNTEYHIDLLARNIITLRETTFIGLAVRTKLYQWSPPQVQSSRHGAAANYFSPLKLLNRHGRHWFGMAWQRTEVSGAVPSARLEASTLNGHSWTLPAVLVIFVVVAGQNNFI